MSSRPTHLTPLVNAPQPNLPTNPLHQPTPTRAGQLPPLGSGNSRYGVLTAKRVVWKAKKQDRDPGDPNNWTSVVPSDSSLSSSSAPPVAGSKIEILKKVVGPTEVAKVTAVAANEFISQVGEILASASVALGFAALPVLGGTGTMGLGVGSIGRGVSNALDERGVTKAVSKMRRGTAAVCGRSIAKYFENKSEQYAKQGAIQVASGAANVAAGLTGVGAPLGATAGAAGFAASKLLEIRALWTEFVEAQEANKYLAQGSVDATNYYKAAEVCPVVAAYVLAAFPAKDFINSTDRGVAKQFGAWAKEILEKSYFAVESGEQPPSSLARSAPDSSPRRQDYIIDGGLVPDALMMQYGPPKSVVMSVKTKIGAGLSSMAESIKDKLSTNSNASNGNRSSSYAIGDPAGLNPPANRYNRGAQQAAYEGMRNQI
jgi:hypothetical protein